MLNVQNWVRLIYSTISGNETMKFPDFLSQLFVPTVFPREGETLWLLSEMTYATMSWDISAASVKAEMCVTQTRPTLHHIKCKEPYHGFCMCTTNQVQAVFSLFLFVS